MSYLESLHRAHMERRARLFPVCQQAVDFPRLSGTVPAKMYLGLDPDFFGGCERKAADILNTVIRVTHVRKVDLISSTRQDSYVRARHIAMYLLRNLTPLSYPQIGRLLGGRHHTTVMHGVRCVAAAPRRYQPWLDQVADSLSVPKVAS